MLPLPFHFLLLMLENGTHPEIFLQRRDVFVRPDNYLVPFVNQADQGLEGLAPVALVKARFDLLIVHFF